MYGSSYMAPSRELGKVDMVAGKSANVGEGVGRGPVSEGQPQIQSFARILVLAGQNILEAQGRPGVPDLDEIGERIVVPVGSIDGRCGSANRAALAQHVGFRASTGRGTTVLRTRWKNLR